MKQIRPLEAQEYLNLEEIFVPTRHLRSVEDSNYNINGLPTLEAHITVTHWTLSPKYSSRSRLRCSVRRPSIARDSECQTVYFCNQHRVMFLHFQMFLVSSQNRFESFSTRLSEKRTSISYWLKMVDMFRLLTSVCRCQYLLTVFWYFRVEFFNCLYLLCNE